jgi:hypothetical protein
MPRIRKKDLADRYKKYTGRVKEIVRKDKETEQRAIQMAAIEFRVSDQTIKNAMNNRPSKG